MEKDLSKEMLARIHTTLDELVTLNQDAASGYEKAASLLDDKQYRQVCLDYSRQRLDFADELQELNASYGGHSATTQSATGILHQLWLNVINIVTDEDSSILEQCVTADESVINTYYEATQKELPDGVAEVIKLHLSHIRAAHQHIHRLTVALMQ